MTVAPLPAHKLYATTDAARIPWESSQAIPRAARHNGRHMLQPRALQALELALNITTRGFNVFVCGDAHLGRSYIVQEVLRPHARKAATPPDLIHVSNFADPDRPRLIALPAGQGRKLKTALANTLTKVRKELSSRYETDVFVKQRGKLLDKFQKVRLDLLKRMENLAIDEGFNLDLDENGDVTLYPLVQGKRVSEEEFEALNADVRAALKRKGDALLQTTARLMRQLARAEQDFREDERTLEREVARRVLDALLSPLVERTLKACPGQPLREHFAALRADILDNLATFLPREATPSGGPGNSPDSPSGPPAEAHHGPTPLEQTPYVYDINLLVDNSGTIGAPIIEDDHPTAANLLGCMEREAEMGALVTDFTLIKAGSLHKAHGGFLLLHMDDVLQYPLAWEGLMRTLRSGQLRIEDASEMPDNANKPRGIEPEPLEIDVKVILVGNDAMYAALLENDERFAKLFKIKADLADATERNATGIKTYLSRMAGIIEDAGLLPFDRQALAWMVDFGSRLVEDQRKLSLKFPLLRDIMIEASALAVSRNGNMVTRAVLEEAHEARIYRANLVEELFMEEYDRDMIKVRTSGTAVGRVNGLSVTGQGNFEFGLPHQISCSVGVGHGGIIDLEREAELGGPIHTKAMMILKNYLVSQFARRKPLVLTGSLCFEQSYAGIEGDSASGAELVALLSAIAEVPVRLDLAFTGAVSQSGQIMAVGGVTHKIEGFFKVCARHGLTGTQGVLIPHDNRDHLMLSPQVIEAVRAGRFAIYPIRHIDEALELLTGLPAGKRRKNDTYTKGSLYDLVDRRLTDFGHYAEEAYTRKRR